jgi:hypothetical protein
MHHHWQDIVLAVSIFVFNLALLPTVKNKSKPALSTCVLTALFMLATVVVYVSLSLWYTTIMSSINALLWGILAAQNIRQRKPSKRHR